MLLPTELPRQLSWLGRILYTNPKASQPDKQVKACLFLFVYCIAAYCIVYCIGFLNYFPLVLQVIHVLNYPLIAKYLHTMLQHMDRTNDVTILSLVATILNIDFLVVDLVVMCEKNHSKVLPITITSTVIVMYGI